MCLLDFGPHHGIHHGEASCLRGVPRPLSGHRSPDLQEVGVPHAATDEVVAHVAARLCPLAQQDDVSLHRLAQRLHRGHRRLHVLLVQPIVGTVWEEGECRQQVIDGERGVGVQTGRERGVGERVGLSDRRGRERERWWQNTEHDPHYYLPALRAWSHHNFNYGKIK